MNKSKRLMIMFVLAALILALPTTVLANKRLWKASLSSANELHEVVGSSARGSATFATFPDGGIHFMLNVRGLSGPATGAHLHAPATESENASVVVTLCGNPTPGAVATCTTDADGNMFIEGSISSSLLRGITAATFFSYLEDGLVYVNVHTALNPAGETRGQLIER